MRVWQYCVYIHEVNSHAQSLLLLAYCQPVSSFLIYSYEVGWELCYSSRVVIVFSTKL